MIKVVFVGDTISKTNTHPDIAFVGAKCLSTLIHWIKFIAPDYYMCLNSDTWKDLEIIRELDVATDFIFIALGNKASNRLNKYGVEHYKLDHPSGLNRKINDSEYVTEMLNKCKEWTRE